VDTPPVIKEEQVPAGRVRVHLFPSVPIHGRQYLACVGVDRHVSMWTLRQKDITNPLNALLSHDDPTGRCVVAAERANS
jgi:hypothetical protein